MKSTRRQLLALFGGGAASLAGCTQASQIANKISGNEQSRPKVYLADDSITIEPNGDTISGQISASDLSHREFEADDTLNPSSGRFQVTGDSTDHITFANGSLDALAFTSDSAPCDVFKDGQLIESEVQSFSRQFSSTTPQPTSNDDRETSTPTQSETPHSFGGDFVDQFEDGSREDWDVVWLQANAMQLNDWKVDQTNVISGEYSLHLQSDADRNALATSDPVIDISGDFDFEYAYVCPEDSRGAIVSLISTSQNGSKSDRLSGDELDGLPFAIARRWPGRPEASMNSFGIRETYSLDTFPPNQVNRIRFERRGDTIRGYRNGSQLYEASLSESDLDIDFDRKYRLMLVSSGSWGSRSQIWFDDIAFQKK